MTGTPADSGPWTVARLLQWTQDYFQRHELEDARLCSEILLAHAMGCERIFLYTQFDQTPPPAAVDAFRAAVRQAVGGEPIAYIIGRKEFFALDFQVNEHVLIPRPETEVLVERVLRLLRSADHPDPTVLDLGAGSGCIAVSLAKHLTQAKIHASDISSAALAIAQTNAARHGVDERIEFREGDLFVPWEGDTFDVIVSNPPYVAERDAETLAKSVRDFEPQQALFAGPEGLGVIQRLLDEAPAHLRPAGHLFIEIGYDQHDAVAQLARDAGWSSIQFHRDAAGHARVFHARREAVNHTQVA
jgi:release factor glutamine methyltransferase